MTHLPSASFRLSVATAAIALLAVLAILPAGTEQHSFRAADGQFLLDGKPFRIISGEMHYARIPREYWRDRLRMAKAMGLNTVTTYVFWNAHEPRPGIYDFSGNLDVAEFVREAQQEGLYVILRPGPYSCAEWEFGGFPAWLLKDPNMVVRSRNPQFLAAAHAWLVRLGREVAPLQIGNGGPIIAVQVENEYGSYGDDHEYMEGIHHILVDAGFTQSQLYTADGAEELPRGSLPELPAVINFGPGEAQRSFATLRKLRPEGPFMNGEYWDGWFDHWGAPHAHTNAQQQADDLDWILRQGDSISIYMFHGGTSFGWMNGANSNGKNYEPDVTSYDYDSALDESGHPTPKYFLFRDASRAIPASPRLLSLPRPQPSPSPPSPWTASHPSGTTCLRPFTPNSLSPWKRWISPTATSSTARRSTAPSAAIFPSAPSTTTPRSISMASSPAPSTAASTRPHSRCTPIALTPASTSSSKTPAA